MATGKAVDPTVTFLPALSEARKRERAMALALAEHE